MQKKRRFGMKNVIASVLTAALVLTSTPSGVLAGELLEVETEEMEGISPVEELAETAPAEGAAEDALSLFGEDDADEAMFSVSEDVEADEAVTESDVATGNEDATETVTEAALYYAETVAISAATEQAIAGVVEGTVAKVVAREISFTNEEIDPEAEVTVTITTTEEEKAALAEAESLALVRVIDDAQAELVPAEKIVGEVTADGAQFLAGDSSVYAIVATESTTVENTETELEETTETEAVDNTELTTEAATAAEEEVEAASVAADATTATVNGIRGWYYTYFTAELTGAHVAVAIPSFFGTSVASMQASLVDAAEYEELINADYYGKVITDLKAIEITFFDDNGNVVKAGSVGAEIELASTGAETYVMYQQSKSSMKKAASSDVPYFSFNIKNGGTYVFAGLADDGIDRAEGVTSRGITTFDLTTADGTSIQVSAPKAAFSGTTYLEAAEADTDYTMVKASDALTENNEMLSDVVKAFDLSFHSAAGTEVEPARDVTVTVEAALDADGDYRLVQIKDDGTTEVLEEQQVSSNEASATFSADACFTYAITEVVTMVDYLTADGKTLKVTVTFDENEVIPEGAQLVVKEVREGDETWGARSARFAEVLSDNYGNVTISDARFLDISIMVDGEEYEPKSPAVVKIEYVDSLYTENTQETFTDPMLPAPIEPYGDDHFVMVHYTNDGAEVLDAETQKANDGIVESVSTTASFSEYDVAYVYEYDAPEPGSNTTFGTIGGNHSANEVGAMLNEENVVFAASAGDPSISKTLADNNDGTFQLGLSVTGEAVTSTTTPPVNVVIVYDVSTSMTGNRIPTATGAYGIQYYDNFDGGSDGTYFQLYKRSGNSYTAITDAEEYTGTVYRRTGGGWGSQYQYSAYTGQRHHASITRADAGEKVVYDFTHALFGYQNPSSPSNIQASLVTFSRTATRTQGWTSTETDITNRVSNTGTSHKLGYSNYTNWEAALYEAYRLVNSADNDPTYVVFITDGQPTESNYNNQYTGTNVSGNAGNAHYLRALNEARLVEQAVEGKSGEFFSIYAYGKAADWLASLTYYAYNGSRPASNIEGTTFSTKGYYNASDTAALTAAINEIFSKIVDTLGVGSASIDDGTTHAVQTTSGEIAELLEVDDTSFQYWLTIPVVASGGNYTFSMPDKQTGDTVNYTATVSGGNVTITWAGGSATYKGEVNAGSLTLEWTGSTSFYNFNPPSATFNETSGAVDWDLNALGTLLSGVTYTVTFDVYPSQYTLDLIADLKNDPSLYNTLDANIKKYLVKDGDDYKLATNTGAVLTYKDTRIDDTTRTKDFVDPDPQNTSAAKSIALSKDWSNILDSRTKPASLEMYVTRDGNNQYQVVLNDANHWASSVWISYGLMTIHNGVIDLKTTGHDYSFSEPKEMDYYWELDVPTLRPMLINSVETLLVKVEEDEAPAMTGDNATAVGEDGYTYYKLTIDGETEYYKVDEAVAELQAVNHRRSYLDVVKTVTGKIVPEGDEFPFTITVTNSHAEDGTADDLNSDYWVWFSVADSNDGYAIVIDENLVSGSDVHRATDTSGAYTGYYYMKSGTQVTVNMQNGYSMRFLNLPTGSTYTVEEDAFETGSSYSFVSIEKTRSYKETADDEEWLVDEDYTEKKTDSQSITGTIEVTDSAYKVEVVNKCTGTFYVYHSSDNTIEKIFADDSRVTADGEFNLVNETKTGFLYGGYYKGYGGTSATDAQLKALTYNSPDSKGYTYATKTVASNTWAKDTSSGVKAYTATDGTTTTWSAADAYYDVAGDAMKPQIDTIYYLKEVPDTFLRSGMFRTYLTFSQAITGFYLLSSVDDGNYRTTGFITNYNNSGKVADLYENIEITYANHTTPEDDVLPGETTGQYTEKLVLSNVDTVDKFGYLSMVDYTATVQEKLKNGGTLNILPYVVTPDGIRVTGIKLRQANVTDNETTYGTAGDGIIRTNELTFKIYSYKAKIVNVFVIIEKFNAIVPKKEVT